MKSERLDDYLERVDCLECGGDGHEVVLEQAPDIDAYGELAEPFASMRFVLGPFNFNFHAEHHLHAAVPSQHLAALHAYLDERDALTDVRVYPSYRRRFADVVRDLREHPLVQEP